MLITDMCGNKQTFVTKLQTQATRNFTLPAVTRLS